MADKIKVTAGEGRITPIDPTVATAPGATRLFLKPGDEIEVDPSNPHVLRAMRDGDLVRVEPHLTPTLAETAAKFDTTDEKAKA